MGTFRTKLDFSSNRQVKQYEKTITTLSGGTSFGVTFSALTSGPDLSSTGITESISSIASTFSGNSGTTNFNWFDSRMSLGQTVLSAITPLNSATTQTTGLVLTSNTTTVIDGNLVALSYSGVSFDMNVIAMYDLGSGNYSGTVTTLTLDIFSADTLDYTGRTIWNDVHGITRTEKLIITNNPMSGYVWTCIDSEGAGEWQYNGSSSGSTIWTAGTGANSAVLGGSDSIAINDYAVAEGYLTQASGYASHSENYFTEATGDFSHAEGYSSVASGFASHAEGRHTNAKGIYSHAQGRDTQAVGDYSHAEGQGSIATGTTSHAEGGETNAFGDYSHAEGNSSFAWGTTSHAEGNSSVATGYASHAEGGGTLASGDYSHAEGYSDSFGVVTASGLASHAEGHSTQATGEASHAQGFQTIASGETSHASGYQAIASGFNSFVHGENSQATNTNTVVFGKDISGTSANTVYVPNLNINLIGSGTKTTNLAVDSTGNVISGTTGDIFYVNKSPEAIPFVAASPTSKGIPEGQVITGFTTTKYNNTTTTTPPFGSFDNATGVFTVSTTCTLLIQAWIHLKTDTSSTNYWSTTSTGQIGMGITVDNPTDFYCGDYQVALQNITNHIDISTSTIVYATAGTTFKLKVLNQTDRNYAGSGSISGDQARMSFTRLD